MTLASDRDVSCRKCGASEDSISRSHDYLAGLDELECLCGWRWACEPPTVSVVVASN